LFLTENEMKFVQMRHFLKGIVELSIKKETKYGRISAIPACRQVLGNRKSQDEFNNLLTISN
jgi:hypothetical protein